MSLARYNGEVQDTAGNGVSSAHIEVRAETVGQPLAALYSDRAGTIAIGNPFDAGTDGSFGFHVAGGAYKIRAYTGPSGAPTFEKILRYQAVGLNAESDSVTAILGGTPLFILTTGQSNYAAVKTFAWTPNANAKMWNNTVDTAGAVGTAFVALSATTVSMPARIASAIADAYPLSQVYVLNVAHSGQAISHWMTGTGSPDAYADIVANITAAMAAAGVSEIDLFCWWQGEADSAIGSSPPTMSTTYLANHATVMTRFWGNSWFPRETPVIINGMSSQADAGGLSPNADTMNDVLLAVAAADPDKRRFVYTAALSGSTYWDVSNPGHMTGQGYFSAGAMTASAFVHGGRGGVKGFTPDPFTGNIAVGTPGTSSTAKFAVNANTSQFVPEHPSLGAAVSQKYGKDATFAYELFDSFAHTSQYIGRRANGTAIAKTALALNDVIFGIAAQGYNGSAYTDNRASLVFTASQTWTTGANGTYLSIYNTPSGTTAPAENLRVSPGALKLLATTGSDVDLDGLPWTAWTSTVTATSGTFTTLGTITARYKKIGKTVFFYLSVPITTNGSAAGVILATLPFTAANFSYQMVSGRENGITGGPLSGRIPQNTAQVQIATAANPPTYPGQNGALIDVAGQYETT
jgi:hypothetical protein